MSESREHPLRKARRKRGLSLEKLADQIGIDIGALSRYERGLRAPSLESANRLLDFFPELKLRDLRLQ